MLCFFEMFAKIRKKVEELKWNSGAMEQWSSGTVEQWNSGTVEQWSSGTMFFLTSPFLRFSISPLLKNHSISSDITPLYLLYKVLIKRLQGAYKVR